MKRKYAPRTTHHAPRIRVGSALILTVVLTSLLAIVGVMFLMVARVDKIATSAISENKELNLAVETVVAKISQKLVEDVPGIGPSDEYYDYPGNEDKWLASLEPNEGQMWRQISDVYNRFASRELKAKIIPDYQQTGDVNEDLPADADGDGVADSRWVKVDDMTSNKGKDIYAAIRIIDNGAMLNVNTAYKFDPTETDPNLIDGSSQMQINLFALSERGSSNTLGQLDNERYGSEPKVLDNYIRDVVWRYNEPNGLYTPFDISDELELRNRFILNHPDIDVRIEEVWDNAFQRPNLQTPVTSDLTNWFYRTQHDVPGPNDIYSYKHLGTIYNMDRIIDPNGDKMFNINTATPVNKYTVRDRIKTALIDNNPNFVDVERIAAQVAVNLIDFRDNDSNVTTIDVNGIIYYGFEAQPFISEIGIKIDALDPNNNSYYAVELYNPFNIPIPLDDFTLSIYDQTGSAIPSVNLGSGSIAADGYHVVSNDLSRFTIDANATTNLDAGLVLSGNYITNPTPPPAFLGWYPYDIALKRNVGGIYLDSQETESSWFAPGTEKYAQRDDDDWHIVYQKTMSDANSPGSLGSENTATVANKNYNLALANNDFVTVGDVSRLLIIGPSTDPNDMLGRQLDSIPLEGDVRIDLSDANYQSIFNYLTVFDPTRDGIDNDGDGITDETDPNKTLEFKVPGRININTAPWYVIAQLPWMTPGIAQAVVSYRDTTGVDGFESIGDLMQVPEMYYYKTVDGGDLIDFPDLTYGDGAIDDFEERDVIFARISNLVTVRSDVFTAYILVRIGTDGPQKRVIAIFDRSDVYSSGDRVRIIALHAVPDPR